MFVEAVILFFEKRDPITIHHLIHAVHEILRKKTDNNFIANNKYLIEEGRELFYPVFVKSKNFIKHADKDPDEELDFNTNLNMTILLDCACMINACLGGDFFPAKLYIMWMAVESPHFFLQTALPDIMKIREAGFDHNDFESLVVSLKYWVKTDHLKKDDRA